MTNQEPHIQQNHLSGPFSTKNHHIFLLFLSETKAEAHEIWQSDINI